MMRNKDDLKDFSELRERVKQLEIQFEELNKTSTLENEDWDNATLIREWGICERTAANYRQQGLEYYKRGGRIYYTPEDREAFEKKKEN